MGLGRLDEAKAMFVAARAHNLDSDFLRLNCYTLAFLERDSSTVREQVDWAKGKPGYEDTLLNAQSNVEAYFGRLANARELQPPGCVGDDNGQCQRKSSGIRRGRCLA